MDKKAIKDKMNASMKEAKENIKQSGKLITGLKKRDRETEDYKERFKKAQELMKEALALLDSYNSLSKELYGSPK